MNPQVIAFVLFALLGCMVFVWFALCKVLFNRLERAHPQKYEAMGRPSLVLRNNLANNLSFLRFLARREYVALNDAALTKLCKAMRIYFVAYAVLFVVLVFVVLRLPPEAAA
jgi:hypothetical protein